ERVRLTGGVPVEDGDAFVVATSGTTGEPRGAVLTHDGVAASARATSSRLGVAPQHDRWCCCLPLAHVGGLSVVTRALATGTRLEVLGGFDAGEVQAAADERGATLVSLVPTTLRRLGPGAAARWRCIVLGGSAPPAGLASNVVTTYGMTETGSGVVYDGLPLDGVEVRIAGAGAQGAAGDEGGEIELRGPMLLRCYRDGTSPLDGDGWLRTGDAGRIGPDGRLEVFGRVAELVVTGGENVWPAAVEAVLARHPAVAEVAVAGLPDPEWGERVVAFVVPRDTGATGAAPPELAELRELVGGELGAFAAPKQLVVVDALPRTSIGKLRRAELAALVLDGGTTAPPRSREAAAGAAAGAATQ
ncbi:MAG TPA: fatty acid--CoA ligase family protein, partial [Acidimicrobiales bacterium]|nr:fatty acid--CoA ligase family protein [Acidimicrobiales bacterium]